MRNKELKNLLKSKASRIEIKDFSNEILNNVNHMIETPRSKKRNVSFAYLASGIIAALSCIIIALFSIRGNSVKPDLDPTPGPITSLSKQEMVLTREAVALGNVVETISAIDTIDSPLVKLASDLEDDDEDDDELEDDEDNKKLDINSYKRIALEMNAFLYSADSFINNENLEASISLNEDTTIPYTYIMKIVMLDNNFKKEYLLYYSENKHDNVSYIDGAIIINNESHKIKGERHDKKNETSLTLMLYLSNTSYIAIENETEINENEYQYSFYNDGRLIREVSMEIENENGLKEASIEILENNIKKEVELEYHEDRIEASYSTSEIELEMTIQIFDSYYLYYFEDADLKITLNK